MKKIISALLSFAVSACFTMPFYAAAPQKIKSLHPQFTERLSAAALDDNAVPVSSLQSLSVRPGSVLDVILVGRGSDLFLDQDGDPINTADVTVSKMRATGVALEVYAETGANLIESAGIEVQNAGTPAAKPVLRVQFASEFNGLEPESFDFTVYISIGGIRQEQSRLNIAGTLGSPERQVDSTDAGVYAEGFVIVALEDIPYIELQAGYGVTVAAALRQGGRYRVQARSSDDPDDAGRMEKDVTLADVILLEADGFGGGDISGVLIESAESFQVYDENGDLLGETMSAQPLPFNERYYLVWRDSRPDIADVIKPLS